MGKGLTICLAFKRRIRCRRQLQNFREFICLTVAKLSLISPLGGDQVSISSVYLSCSSINFSLGSLSSYHSQEYRPSGHYQRDGHSRQSSMSQRQYTSPDATKSGPLTAGFQARHSPSALSEIQSTVAQLNQKHEAVTGISPNTPERSASNETRNVEHTTPSKGKGKGKKMGSIRGSNRPTSVQTPMKSRSQTNFQTHALVDITNKVSVSLCVKSSKPTILITLCRKKYP